MFLIGSVRHRVAGNETSSEATIRKRTGSGVLGPVLALLFGCTPELHGACAAPGTGSPSVAHADVVVAPGGERLHEYLDRLARCGVFSGAVLVAQGDSVLLHGGYGLADARRGIPVTRTTVFDIGSLAKQFAAAAVLRLELDGQVTVEDPLERFFPQAAEDKRGITLHQLLTHTSGFPGDLEAGDQRVTLARDPTLAARLLALPLESEPGTTFRYSNAGYALLRLVIERAARVPFETYVKEHLLQPAELTRTGWHGDTSLWTPEEVARGAWGLYDSGSPRDWPLHGATAGAGQMISSPGELMRWLRALDSGTILPEDARKRLFTPQVRWGGPGAGERGSGAEYGYGWELRMRSDGALGLAFHNGTYGDFRTTVRRYSRDAVTIIVTTNSRQQDASDRADEVGNALFDLLLGEEVALAPPTLTVPAEELAAFEGSYLLPDGAHVRLARMTPDRLWLAPHGQSAFDALWAPDPERRNLNERVAQRTLEVIESLRSPAPAPEFSGWSAMFRDWVGLFGPFERVELDGVAPLTWSKVASMSYTVLHFARGRITVTWEWNGEELVKTMSSVDVPEPQGVPLAPVGPTSFVVYDWFTGRSLLIEREARDSLRIGSGEEAPTATFVPSSGPAR